MNGAVSHEGNSFLRQVAGPELITISMSQNWQQTAVVFRAGIPSSMSLPTWQYQIIQRNDGSTCMRTTCPKSFMLQWNMKTLNNRHDLTITSSCCVTSFSYSIICTRSLATVHATGIILYKCILVVMFWHDYCKAMFTTSHISSRNYS